MTEGKRPSRLALAMLETAKDMRSTGILDEAAYKKITMRHLGVKDEAGFDEVVSAFLEENSIRVHSHNTLVGFFDIQGYSAFIEETEPDEAIMRIDQLFLRLRNSASANLGALRIDPWILSDSIVVVLDTNRSPLYGDTLLWFLATCSSIMSESLKEGFPLRGAIGGGYFYKDGELMISSGLADAASYERKQNWLGAVLTPNAIQIIEDAKKHNSNPKVKMKIDLGSSAFNLHIKYGKIPWKEKKCGRIRRKESPDPEMYYLKPYVMAPDKNWAEYLPSYFHDPQKVANSDPLYAEV